MTVYNVAIVGLGIGRSHIAEGYTAHPDKFRVEAICDLNSERLSVIGDDFGVPVRTNRFDEILAMPEIDIIDICTPPNVHVDQILAALAAGKQVICEKPLVGSLADLDRVAKAEAAARGRVMPIFQYRYGDGLQKARRIVEAGIAGKAYLATVETAWKRGADYYAVPWRGKLETELGGVLLTHAIHSHDIMTYLLGPVASVFARTTTRVNPIEVEDCAVASLAMADGSLVSLAATLGSQVEISRLRFCFENVTFESGLKPYAPGDAPWQIIPASPEIALRIEGALADWETVPSRFAGQLGRYHATLERGEAPPVTLDDARRSLELATALFHSAETGQVVDLPIRPDHPKYADWRPQPKAVA
jgi:predicted dehydrogenase